MCCTTGDSILIVDMNYGCHKCCHSLHCTYSDSNCLYRTSEALCTNTLLFIHRAEGDGNDLVDSGHGIQDGIFGCLHVLTKSGKASSVKIAALKVVVEFLQVLCLLGFFSDQDPLCLGFTINSKARWFVCSFSG